MTPTPERLEDLRPLVSAICHAASMENCVMVTDPERDPCTPENCAAMKAALLRKRQAAGEQTQYVEVKTGATLFRHPAQFWFRGRTFSGLRAGNSLYDDPEDSFADHTGIPSSISQGLIALNARQLPEVPQAEIVTIEVRDGEIVGTVMKAPGLPDGRHDLFCAPPEATAVQCTHEWSAIRRVHICLNGCGALMSAATGDVSLLNERREAHRQAVKEYKDQFLMIAALCIQNGGTLRVVSELIADIDGRDMIEESVDPETGDKLYKFVRYAQTKDGGL